MLAKRCVNPSTRTKKMAHEREVVREGRKIVVRRISCLERVVAEKKGTQLEEH